jgi:glycosyltransferase involved in cell wall biosynthesis
MKMRILFIHNYYKGGQSGEDIVFNEEVKLLRSSGYTIETIEFTNDSFNKSILGNVAGALKSLYNNQSAQLVEQTIKNFNPDIIHIHNLFYTASPSIIYAAKRQGIPVVVTLHNYRLVCNSGTLSRAREISCEICLTKTIPLSGIKHSCFRDSKIQSFQLTAITSLHKLTGLWRSVDKFIVLSEFARKKMLESSLKLTDRQLTVKPNFVHDLSEQNLSYSSEDFIYVGRLSIEKGVLVLLNAFAGTNYALKIVGDGPLKAEVLHVCSTNENIKYLGQLNKDEVRSYMKYSTALIFPSICNETFGLSIIEAFSVGCPVITSKIGAPKEIITPFSNGLHFTPGSSIDLRKQISYWTTLSKEQKIQYKLNARLTYQMHYTAEANKNYLVNIYKELISNK